MSNSPLVNHTNISPNRSSPRSHRIDTITIHCTAGQISVENLGKLFASPSRQASSNYGIGSDGRIGMYVEEKDRSWCSSSAVNDNRAVTIEVSSDNVQPYKVTDKVLNSLISLLVDICQRNGIKKLLWQGNKMLIGQVDKQNMTVHRWFANKACPGDYLYNLHGKIAEEVNRRLGQPRTVSGSVGQSYKVKVTATALNIRSEPSINGAIRGQIKDKGIYTIVEEKNNWGKLKSGAGWISLSYTKRV